MNDPNPAYPDAFAAVARACSFRRAAEIRGVSASSRSDALRRLGARLGVRLLNRTTRSVTPTEAGERLRTASSMSWRRGSTRASV